MGEDRDGCAVERVGLKDAGVTRQMPLGVFGSAIARGVKQRRRSVLAAKRWAATRSEGRESDASVTPEGNHEPHGFVSGIVTPAAVGREVFRGIRQSIPSSR
jgi:hypothetical protein